MCLIIVGSGCIEDPSANITADYCSSTTDDNINYALCKEYQCPANSWIVPLLLSIYSLITCIMLLNVLIAIFKYVEASCCIPINIPACIAILTFSKFQYSECFA